MREDVEAAMIAQVERDLAKLQARPELPRRRIRQTTGPTIVYSVRLDRQEVALLEEHAADIGIKPTALARNRIRSGLAGRHGAALGEAVDRLDQAVQEVRALVR